MRRYATNTLRVLYAGLLLAATGGATAETLDVHYNRQADTLEVAANAVPLSKVLADIGSHAGFAVLFDPQMEQPVTIILREESTQQVLKKLLRRTNYIVQTDQVQQANGDKRERVVSLKVFPEGQHDNTRLLPLVELNQAAQRRADRQARPTERHQKKDKVEREAAKHEKQQQRLVERIRQLQASQADATPEKQRRLKMLEARLARAQASAAEDTKEQAPQ